jgi:autotransporter-associated beta strand protein
MIARLSKVLAIGIALCAGWASQSTAASTTQNDVGYVTLSAELNGMNVPNGAGVVVTQVEAPYQSTNDYMVDVSGYAELSGKTFTDVSKNLGDINSAFSTHAANVARNLAGTTSSIAPGVTDIEVYDVNYWLNNEFLRTKATPSVVQPLTPPVVGGVTSRIANHSWAGYLGTATSGTNTNALMRLDYVVDTEEYIQVVAIVDKNTGSIYPLISGGFNSISVGVTNQADITGTAAGLLGIYATSRQKPDLVAPQGFTSYSTPMVTAAATDLIGYAHTNPGLSNGQAVMGTVAGTVYYGETTQVIRALLMAGADRRVFNSDSSAITNYRTSAANQTTNGLDTRYGAGQVDIRNSYWILNSGIKHSVQDGQAGPVGTTGFDYDAAFGTSAGVNNTAYYNFTGDYTGQSFSASLVWNVKIDPNLIFNNNSTDFTNAATLHNLTLTLVDLTTSATVAVSNSTIENTQNIFTTLKAGDNYQLQVSAAGEANPYSIEYGLAWTGKTALGWSGAQNGGTWDATSANWFNGSAVGQYLDGEHVEFTDGAANPTVTLTANVAPASVYVNNSLFDYTFTSNNGSGITGLTGLIKEGTGTLNLNTANSYTGGTFVNAGTLSVGTNNAIPLNSVLTLASNGTVKLNANSITLSQIAGSFGTINTGTGSLTLNSSTDAIINPTWTGGGTINKQGTNRLSPIGDATAFSGVWNISNGSLAVHADGELGNSSAQVNVLAGGTLEFDASSATAVATTINGAGYNSLGALYLSQNGSFGGKVTVATNSTVNTPAGIAFALTNGISIANGVTLTMAGAGALTISGAQTNSFGSQLTNATGTLNLNSDGGTNLFVITSGGTSITNFNAVQSLSGAILSDSATLNVVTGNSTVANLTTTTGTTNTVNLNLNANQLTVGGAGSKLAWGAGVTTAVSGAGGTLVLAPEAGSTVSATTPTLKINSGAAVKANAATKDPFTDSGNSSQHVALANNGTFTLTNGSAVVGNVSGGGNTVVATSASLIAGRFVQNSLTVQAGGAATVATSNAAGPFPLIGLNSQVSVLNSLNIANDGGALGSRTYTATFDLKNNDLIIEQTTLAGAQDVYNNLVDMLAAGINTGKGLVASLSDSLTGLGVMSNANAQGNPILSTFDGVGVDQYATLVKFTYLGDLNLDGVVDGNEIASIVNGFNLHLGGWSNGDLNYSGVVDGNDVAAAVNAFNGQGVHGTPLPEPSGLILAGIGLLSLVWGRRKFRLKGTAQ